MNEIIVGDFLIGAGGYILCFDYYIRKFRGINMGKKEMRDIIIGLFFFAVGLFTLGIIILSLFDFYIWFVLTVLMLRYSFGIFLIISAWFMSYGVGLLLKKETELEIDNELKNEEMKSEN